VRISHNIRGHERRMTRGIAVAATLIAALFAGFALIPAPASAAIANENAILSVSTTTVYGNVKWDFTSFDCIELRTYVNGILRDTYTPPCGGPGNTGNAYVGLGMESGPWRLQLWSTNANTELWAKSYSLPGLALASSVAPSTGGIGTAFVITSTLVFATGGPDAYTGVGAISTTDGTTTITDSRIAFLESAHYFAFWNQAPIPLLAAHKMAATFSYSAAGSHSISAVWSDGFSNVSSSAASVTVTDQYGPTIAGLQTQITDLQHQNDQLRLNLTNSDAKAVTLNSALNSAQTLTLAIGVVALILAIVGIAIAYRAGRARGPRIMAPQAPPPP